MKLEATHLRGNSYAVRPEGCLGTHGWAGGKAWSAFYTKARSAEEAIRKAQLQNHFKEIDDAPSA